MDYASLLPEFLRNLNPLALLTNNYIVLDLETSIIDDSPSSLVPENSIVCAAWCDNKGRVKSVYGDEYEMYDLIQDCYDAELIVGHNIKFDLMWLARAGLDLSRVLIYDTMIGEYVLTGNLLAGKKGALTLDTLAKQYLGYGKSPFIDQCMKGKGNPADMIASLLVKRCRSDILQTRDIFLAQREKLHNDCLLPCMYTRCLLTPALADIESNGVHLDEAIVTAEYDTSMAALKKVEAELSVFMNGVNPNSVPQKKKFIYEELKFKPPKKGRNEIFPTGTDDILTMLKPTNNRQRKFLELMKEYSRHHADISKNLTFFKGIVDEHNCIFYAQFNQAVTATHRLSSSAVAVRSSLWDDKKGAQLQNMPRKYKKVLSSRHPGWYMVEADGAQIEFRVAGFIGQDVRICQDIVDGADIHKFTASAINQIPESEVTGEMRTNAKPDTFKPLYGGQYGTDGQMRYYAAFREKYPGITKQQRVWEGQVLRNKSMRTVTGLRFSFPSCKVRGDGYNPDFPSICNYPVQNLATAEIVPVSIVAIWHVLKASKMATFLVNTIHDSVVSETPPDEIQEYYRICKWAFLWWVYEYLDRVYNLQFNVPLGVGFKAGLNWGKGIPGLAVAEVGPGEMAVVDGSEIKVTGVPIVRMQGVDYSRLETSND